MRSLKNNRNPSYIIKHLPNGLPIAIRPMEHANSVSIGVWVKSGGRYETKKESGISHFIEHMLFKGSKSFGCEALKRSIEGVGGSLNGFTAEEFTCFMAKVPSVYSTRAINLLSDMVLNPLIRQTDISKEREVIIEEIRMYEDTPAQYVHDIFNQLLWPNHPLGYLLSGTEESVKGITRKDMLSFMDRFYHPGNMLIACAGAVDPNKLIDRISKLFGNHKKSQKREERFIKSPKIQPSKMVKIVNKATEQVHLCLGTKTMPRAHPKRFALEMLHVLLGANMSSRLFHQIREKRALAYDIGTHLKRYDDTGAFVIYAGCDAAKLDKTLKSTGNELRKIKTEPVPERELKRAKEFYKGQLLMALEETMENMLWIGEQMVTVGRIAEVDEMLDRINQVNASQIQMVAKNLFKPEAMSLAVIGPVKENELKDINKIF